MYLNLDHVCLHYETAGQATNPTLLLWHGARCTLRQWDHVVPKLCDEFHIVRFDARGAGASSAESSADYCFESYAEDACELLDYLEVGVCHVWSMAWGARAALTFAALHPEAVASAAFYDLSIGTADVKAQMEGAKVARKRLRATGYNPPSLPAGWNTHTDEDTLMKSLGAAGKTDLAVLAPKLVMPVLVATGDHDPNLASSREAAALMPNAELFVLPDVGHGSVLMQPDLTTEIFLGFVRQHV